MKTFIAGEKVYVVIREENGEAFEYAGYMYLAQAGTAAIVSPYINHCTTIEGTMQEHIQTTAADYGTCLAVFPLEDCYETGAKAKEALEREVNGCE